MFSRACINSDLTEFAKSCKVVFLVLYSCFDSDQYRLYRISCLFSQYLAVDTVGCSLNDLSFAALCISLAKIAILLDIASPDMDSVACVNC